MGAPYSQDLRLRVLAALDEGLSKWQVHQRFKVSRSTIDDWLKLRAETGEVAAKTNYHRGPLAAIEDCLEVRAFIEAHKNSTLAQLAKVWFNERGQRLSTVTFSNTLKRLGYSRKKRATSTKNAVQNNERTLNGS